MDRLLCFLVHGDVDDKKYWKCLGGKFVSLFNSGKLIPWKPSTNFKRENTTTTASSWMHIIHWYRDLHRYLPNLEYCQEDTAMRDHSALIARAQFALGALGNV